MSEISITNVEAWLARAIAKRTAVVEEQRKAEADRQARRQAEADALFERNAKAFRERLAWAGFPGVEAAEIERLANGNPCLHLPNGQTLSYITGLNNVSYYGMLLEVEHGYQTRDFPSGSGNYLDSTLNGNVGAGTPDELLAQIGRALEEADEWLKEEKRRDAEKKRQAEERWTEQAIDELAKIAAQDLGAVAIRKNLYYSQLSMWGSPSAQLSGCLQKLGAFSQTLADLPSLPDRTYAQSELEGLRRAGFLLHQLWERLDVVIEEIAKSEKTAEPDGEVDCSGRDYDSSTGE